MTGHIDVRKRTDYGNADVFLKSNHGKAIFCRDFSEIEKIFTSFLRYSLQTLKTIGERHSEAFWIFSFKKFKHGKDDCIGNTREVGVAITKPNEL